MTKLPLRTDIEADYRARQIVSKKITARDRATRFEEKHPKVFANLVKRITTCTAGHFLFHKFYEPLSPAEKREFCKILSDYGYPCESVASGGKHKVRVWMDAGAYDDYCAGGVV